MRVPFSYFEFNSGGSVYEAESKAVIIAQKLSTGSATTGALTIVPDGAEDGLFGKGSMASLMVKNFKKNAPSVTPYVIPLADPTGVKATATITVSDASASVNETIILRIHGTQVTVPVLEDDDQDVVATAIAAAINAKTDLLVTASATTNVVTLTARHFGTMMNGLRITVIESVIALVATNTASGTGLVDLSATFDAIPENQYYDWIGSPYTDTASIAAYDAYTNDISGTWSPLNASLGHIIACKIDTLGNLSTLGGTVNNNHLTLMGARASVTPSFLVTSAMVAYLVTHLSEAPELSRPLQFLPLQGIEFDNPFTIAERNTLYYDGIGSFRVDRTNTVLIDRCLTTYQTNAQGSQDSTYLDIETMAQLMYASRYLKQRVESVHGRQSLNDDTIEAVRDTIIHVITELKELDVAENIEAMITLLELERDQTDANRINLYVPLDHVNQLRVFATNVTSFLNIGA